MPTDYYLLSTIYPSFMRIIHLSCVAPPEIGGMGSAAYREVALLRARGVDARLIAPEMRGRVKPEGERSFVDRLQTLARFGNAAALRGVGNALRGADIIHLHYPFYGTAEPLLLRHPFGVPRSGLRVPRVIITFHMDASADGWKGLIFRAHRLFLQSALLSRASRVIVSSLDYALHASLGSFFEKHADRVVELPFGVETDAFFPGASEKSRYAIPPDAPVIGFVGSFDRAHAFKGFASLLEALPHLDASVYLLVIGDGESRAGFEERARALGVAGRVRFAGRLPAEELPSAYRSMDVFAFPSTNKAEAFGLAALEAQSSGVPVVASDLPGVRTVIAHGETGWLVPPNHPDALVSALMTILSDHPLRASMSHKARERALGFSWDSHVDGLMRTYEEVLKEIR